MPSLIVPRKGLPLDFGSKPLAADGMIALTLTDDAIENMIKCIREDKEIQLSYGTESTISYGTNTLRFATSQDNFTYDIYQNTVASNNSPNTPQISKGPRKNNNCELAYMGSTAVFLTPRTQKSGKVKESVAMSKQASQNSQPKGKNDMAGMDQALEQLQKNLATENAKKAANTTQKASSQLPPGGQKRGAAANARLGARAAAGGVAAKRAVGRSTMGSIPTSPALNASSPALGPTSVPASEQAAEKTKTIRAPIIHRLAVAPATEAELFNYKTANATKEEFRSALDKVADRVDGKYMLNNKFYKELDPWSFKYDSQKERQAAIDNAVKAFDKMRMSGSDPEWQLLHPVEERGKGHTLSKLQAKIALNGPMAPSKPKPVESMHGSDDEDDDLFGGSGKTVAASRSTNGTKTKAQKDREAQDKRLSGKATTKQKATTARAAPAAKKEAAPRGSAAAKKGAASSTVKSSEFVNDSDEEDDYFPEPSKKPSPKQAPVKKEAPKASAKRKSDNDDIGGSPPKKAKPAATSSSYSSQSGKSASQEKPRSTQSSQPSQSQSQRNGTVSVASAQRSINHARSKVITSPKKSSPLASSPPVSASDLEESDKSTSVSPAAPTKRKNAEREAESNKRRKGLSSDVQNDSDRFAVLYEKYRTLWHELEGKERRSQEEMERLGGMEAKLRGLKRRIVEGAGDA